MLQEWKKTWLSQNFATFAFGEFDLFHSDIKGDISCKITYFWALNHDTILFHRQTKISRSFEKFSSFFFCSSALRFVLELSSTFLKPIIQICIDFKLFCSKCVFWTTQWIETKLYFFKCVVPSGGISLWILNYYKDIISIYQISMLRHPR